MMLGDLGADVIKIERRITGDQSRTWGPPFVGSESAYFLAANRNKRSLSLDYDQPLGNAILHRLLASADVFLINQRNAASLARRGFDAETMSALYPRLIYCSISGYGKTGPRAGMPGYDIIAQAQAGIMSFTGEPEGEPVRYPIAIADMACGLYSTIGILAALFHREKTGKGQALDMALFDSQLTLLINSGSNYLNAGELPERWGNAHPSIVPYQVFRGGDGRHFVAAVGTERFVAALCAGAGRRRHAGNRCAFSQQRVAHRTSPGAYPCSLRVVLPGSGRGMVAPAYGRRYSHGRNQYCRRSGERSAGAGARAHRRNQASHARRGAQYRQPSAHVVDSSVVSAATAIAGRAQSGDSCES